MKPVDFLYEQIGRHLIPGDNHSAFLTNPVSQITGGKKDKPLNEDNPRRLGAGAPITFLASEGDSIIVGPLNVKPAPGFTPVLKMEPSVPVFIGKWLWDVKAPFMWAVQEQAFVEKNLRISQSTYAGVYSTAKCIETFDLEFCRELATKLIEGGAEKKWKDMTFNIKRLKSTPGAASSMSNLVEAVTKDTKKLIGKYPVLENLRLPAPGTMESTVLGYLIAYKEFENA